MRRVLKRAAINEQTLEMTEYEKMHEQGYSQKHWAIVVKEKARVNRINRIMKHKPIYISLLALVCTEGDDVRTAKLIRSCHEAGFLKYRREDGEYIFVTDEGVQFAQSCAAPLNLILKKYDKLVVFFFGSSGGILVLWVISHLWPILSTYL